jgi:hypothetical protein
MKSKRGWIIWVCIALMLLAIWAYVASLEETQPLDESLSELGVSGEKAE